MRKHYAEHLRLIPCLTFGFSLVLLFACLTSSVQAASPITGSGLNTQVSPPVPLPSGQTQFNITGGTRPGGASGTNLFHSFGDFNVPTNNIANFLNDSGLATSNILGRVTGGNISNIFGAIQTTRIREREPLPDEPGWILVRAERHRERRRDGELHVQQIIFDLPTEYDSMPSLIQPQMRF